MHFCGSLVIGYCGQGEMVKSRLWDFVENPLGMSWYIEVHGGTQTSVPEAGYKSIYCFVLTSEQRVWVVSQSVNHLSSEDIGLREQEER